VPSSLDIHTTRIYCAEEVPPDCINTINTVAYLGASQRISFDREVHKIDADVAASVSNDLTEARPAVINDTITIDTVTKPDIMANLTPSDVAFCNHHIGATSVPRPMIKKIPVILTSMTMSE